MSTLRRFPTAHIAAALFFLTAAPPASAGPHAQRLTRLFDSPRPGAVAVGPSPASIGGVLYFPAWDPKNDSAIWAANGSSQRATLLRNARAQTPVPFGGRAYFVGSDSTSSRLWTSDGSPDGTLPVAELGNPGAGSLTAIGNALYLIGGDGHPWVSDGTAAGTRPLSEDAIVTGSPSFVAWHGAVSFLALGSDAHRGLWSTAGTPETTRRIVDLGASPPGVGRPAYGLTAFRERLYFYTTEDASGSRYRLWISDGTAAGTAALRDFAGTFLYTCPGPCLGGCGRPCVGIGPETLAGLGTNLVLFADDGIHGRELWRTDGTPGGTQLLADISPGGGNGVLSNFGDPQSSGRAGSRVLFGADDGVQGAELWTTDGTAAGTHLLSDIVPGPLGSNPFGFVAVGEQVFFVAADAIWRSDGTAGGTVIFREGAATLYPIEGGFAAVDGSGLWTSDGSSKLKLVDDLARPQGLDPTGLTLFGGNVVFSRLDEDNTLHDLWSYDGAAGTAAVLRHFSSLSSLPVATGGALYFGADDGVHGVEPWISDGTEAGTRLLHDIAVPTPAYPGAVDSDPSVFTAAGSSVYFNAWDGTHGSELWVTDGSDAGTRLLEDFQPGAYGSVPGNLTPFRDGLAFTIAFPSGGLWRTDGTVAGTSETAPVPASFVVDAGGTLFFIGSEDATGSELWRSDGTAAGTRLVKDAVPGPGSQNFYALTPSGLRVFYIGQSDAGQELWTSNGTEAGTLRLGTFRALDALTPLGRSDIVFEADDGVSGLELWRSDGTPEGTRLVRDIAPGPASSSPMSLAAVRGRILFAADDGEHGIEPWVSDGTEEGTRILEDLSPGTTSSQPGQFLLSGDVIYFRASDEEAGAQLWSIPIDALEPHPGERPRATRIAPVRE